jgi:hypothetical protein
MKKLRYILTSILFVACLIAITPGYADDNGNGNNGNANGVNGNGNGRGNEGNGNGNGGSESSGSPLPINKGLTFLLFAGAAIGTVAIYRNGKKGLVNTNV